MLKPTPLPPGASPAAEAVWAAWSTAEIFLDIELTDRCALAAALRAAADQVVPADVLYARSCCEFTGGCARDALLTIAEELEGAR